MTGAVPPGIALPSCLKADPSLKLYRPHSDGSLAPSKPAVTSCRRPAGVKGAQVLLLACPQLSETSGRLTATVTCRGTLQPGQLAQLLMGAGASEAAEAALPSPPTAPLLLLPLQALKHLSLSFLINSVTYHKLTLQRYSEPKRYFTICCVYGKHSKGCVTISCKHNKYNHQRKSPCLLRIRSI